MSAEHGIGHTFSKVSVVAALCAEHGIGHTVRNTVCRTRNRAQSRTRCAEHGVRNTVYGTRCAEHGIGHSAEQGIGRTVRNRAHTSVEHGIGHTFSKVLGRCFIFVLFLTGNSRQRIFLSQRHKFSKVPLYCALEQECTRTLTFENLFQSRRPQSPSCGSSRQSW